MNLTHIAYCGVDCAACPEYLSGKCPDCRHSQWPDGDPCMPIACCQSKGIDCCGRCASFPCARTWLRSTRNRKAIGQPVSGCWP